MREFLIISILFFVACDSSKQEGSQKSTSPPLQAEVIVVKHQFHGENLQASGTFIPNEEVELKAEESGRLVLIAFKEGELVKQGDLLFQIDDREFLAQAKNLQVQLNLAEKELRRNSALLAAEAISEEVYDASANKAAVLKAELDIVSVRLDRCRIKAPFSGRIGLRTVSTGAYISAGQALVYLVKETPMKIEFEVPEVHASNVFNGLKIWAALGNQKDTIRATVYAVEAKINAGSRNIKIRALCDPGSVRVIPGSFVNIVLPLNEKENAILIPSQALVPEMNGQKVFKVVNGKVVSQAVSTGKREPEIVLITEGLQVGDSVLVTGILQARDGMAVKPSTVK